MFASPETVDWGSPRSARTLALVVSPFISLESTRDLESFGVPVVVETSAQPEDRNSRQRRIVIFIGSMCLDS